MLLGTQGDGATNRGFAGEGLFLQAAKQYEGFLVLKSTAAAEVTVTLEPHGGGEALASTTVKYAGGNWSEIAFALMPSGGTTCVGMSFEAANAAGISCPE